MMMPVAYGNGSLLSGPMVRQQFVWPHSVSSTGNAFFFGVGLHTPYLQKRKRNIALELDKIASRCYEAPDKDPRTPRQIIRDELKKMADI